MDPAAATVASGAQAAPEGTAPPRPPVTAVTRPAAAAAPVGGRREERKIVTVLVVRIPFQGALDADPPKGDPEDARDRAGRVHDQVAERIRHYGGILQPAPTGQVLAVFGADRSREDDPERAVRAALDVCATLESEGLTQVRAGLATGQVVITFDAPDAATGAPEATSAPDAAVASPTGTPGLRPVQVVGDVILAAAALESSGPPGAVLVGSGTYRATRQTIDYQPSPQLGLTFGVEVWQALAPRARTGAQIHGQASAPLVEREQQLALMTGLLERFLREREPLLLTVVSEAGLGKSRMVAEFGHLVDQAQELVSWRVGHSPAYGPGGARALAEIIKSHAGILDTDPAATMEAKLRQTVGDAVPDRQEAERIVTQVRVLLGAGAPASSPGAAFGQPGQTATLSTEMSQSWARLLSALATERPLVLVLEDLQWAEEVLLDFVDGLVGQVEGVPLLLVVTARPELLERRPGWGGGKRNAATISLSPLTEAGTSKLLDTLLTGGELPAETRAQLITASGGNPLYVEEYVRMLRERPDGGARPAGVGLAIPESVQQVIAARIDTLATADKRLLQDAAVFGEVSWTGALAETAGRDRAEVEDGLRRLVRREFLRRVRVASVVGETEYAFRHTLIRDGAYQQLLRADRIDKHRRAAAWLEASAPELAADRAGLLAYHYGLALDLTRAADREVGDLAERSRVASRAAGDHASALGAHADAARHYAAALDLWPAAAPDRPDLQFRLGLARVYGEHAGEAELLAARDAYVQAGDAARVAEVDLQLGQVAKIRGDAQAMGAYMERALGGRSGPPPEDLEGALFQSIDLMLTDSYAEAVAGATEMARRARAARQPGLEGAALGVAGQARIDSGDPTGADLMLDAIATMEAHAHPTIGMARYGLAWALWWYGDLAACQRAVDDGLPGLKGAATGRWLQIIQAAVDYAAGRWDAAGSLLDQVVGDQNPTELDHVGPLGLLVRARIRLGRGDLRGALAAVDTALPAAVINPSPRQAQLARALRGQALLASGDPQAAAGCLAGLLADQRRRPHAARVTPEQAELMVDLGEPASALPGGIPPSRWNQTAATLVRGDLAGAVRGYEEIGAPVAAASVRLRLAAQLAERRPADAQAELARAVEVFESAGASAYLSQAKALGDGLP